MKELTRSYIWWPNLDRDLEEVSKSCMDCLAIRTNPPKTDLHSWSWPSKPWHRLHIDYAGPVNGRYFFVLVDAHSKWVEIYNTTGTSTKDTIDCLNHSFSIFGLPVSITSDNGPCFKSSEFSEFLRVRGIIHSCSAVYHPSTNGLAEKMVGTFKKQLSTSKKPIQLLIDEFLFNYRLTPHSTTGVSPAELMFGRRLRSRLDLVYPEVGIKSQVDRKQENQTRNHIRQPRIPDVTVGSPVMVRDFSRNSKKWCPAQIHKQTGPISYECTLEDGSTVKRHLDQVIPRTIKEERTSDGRKEEDGRQPETTTDSDVPESKRPQEPRRSERTTKPVDRFHF